MRKVLQDVKFSDQGRFKQFVLQSKSRMEVLVHSGLVLYQDDLLGHWLSLGCDKYGS